MSVCSPAAALAIPKATSHHCIHSDNFAFVFHEYFCFKLQMYNNIWPLSRGSVCGPRVPAVSVGCADSQQYRLKLVKSVRYWWWCIRNLNFGIICKVCCYRLVLPCSSGASWDDSSVNYCSSYLHTFILQGYKKMQSRTICLRLKVPYFWMWYRVFW
jgi:hypothetical protein